MDSRSATTGREATQRTLITALLTCGVLVAVVQILGDILAAALYPGYSYVNQSVSELSAIAAPTRGVTAVVGFAFELMVVAFAVGVWLVARKRSLKTAGVILGVFAVNAIVWGFFPMQQRGSQMSFTDYAHIGGAILQVLTIVLFIAFGSGADGLWFRVFSIVLIVAILAAGGVAGSQAGQIAVGGPTPLMGLVERISFYGPSVWILVLALELMRQRRERHVLLGEGTPAPTLGGG
jgi:hypothetical protein